MTTVITDTKMTINGSSQGWAKNVDKFGTRTYVGELNVNGASYISQNLYYDGAAWRTENAAAGSFISQAGGNVTVFGAASGGALGSVTPVSLLNILKDQTVALQGANQTAGCGISFPASQVASSDANTLDDYEEGTFTPSLAFGGASVGITYIDRLGWYTKIGNRAFINLRIYISSKGSSVGVASVTGLPFYSVGTTSYYSSAAFGITAGMTAAALGCIPVFQNGPGAATAEIYQFVPTTGNYGTVANTDFTNAVFFNCQFNYATA